MSARTSQLQIRVTPDEKAALNRMARVAGENVSSYLLTRVLPSRELEVARLMAGLGEPKPGAERALSELAQVLQQLSGLELAHSVPAPDPDVPPVTANRVAALVETVAGRKGVEAPPWTHDVPALARPSFRWTLVSLKPHQMRRTPVALKRRNVFMDPASTAAPALHEQPTPEGFTSEADETLLRRLDEELGARDLSVELYLLGGAVLYQAFAASPGTAKMEALFRPASGLHDAVRAVALEEAAADTWLHGAVLRSVGPATGGGLRAFVELPHLRAFEPVPDYVLALKCAAMGLGADSGEAEDVRYLLRFMNLSDADAALGIVHRYVAERQLPSDIGQRIGGLLPG
jgi:uncharacterized protein (DUF1778 family)